MACKAGEFTPSLRPSQFLKKARITTVQFFQSGLSVSLAHLGPLAGWIGLPLLLKLVIQVSIPHHNMITTSESQALPCKVQGGKGRFLHTA